MRLVRGGRELNGLTAAATSANGDTDSAVFRRRSREIPGRLGAAEAGRRPVGAAPGLF